LTSFFQATASCLSGPPAPPHRREIHLLPRHPARPWNTLFACCDDILGHRVAENIGELPRGLGRSRERGLRGEAFAAPSGRRALAQQWMSRSVCRGSPFILSTFHLGWACSSSILPQSPRRGQSTANVE